MESQGGVCMDHGSMVEVCLRSGDASSRSLRPAGLVTGPDTPTAVEENRRDSRASKRTPLSPLSLWGGNGWCQVKRAGGPLPAFRLRMLRGPLAATGCRLAALGFDYSAPVCEDENCVFDDGSHCGVFGLTRIPGVHAVS